MLGSFAVLLLVVAMASAGPGPLRYGVDAAPLSTELPIQDKGTQHITTLHACTIPILGILV